MDFNKDDTFLARWLNNELSEQERKEFEASPDYDIYLKIIGGTENILSPDFDSELMLRKIHDSQSTKQHYWYYGIAATIALLLATVFLFISQDSTRVFESGYGQITKVDLPDGSIVTLNSRSSLSYNEDKWESDRLVKFEGEGFFEVESGSKFIVETSNGKVSVLGTQFNVYSVGTFFESTCYEGKVSVVLQDLNTILEKGQSIRKIDNNPPESIEVASTIPAWLSGTSSFKSTPIKYVLITLENQYGVEFAGAPIDNGLVFSGSFPNDDLDVALKIVLGSFRIDYQIEDDKTIIVQ